MKAKDASIESQRLQIEEYTRQLVKLKKSLEKQRKSVEQTEHQTSQTITLLTGIQSEKEKLEQALREANAQIQEWKSKYETEKERCKALEEETKRVTEELNEELAKGEKYRHASLLLF